MVFKQTVAVPRSKGIPILSNSLLINSFCIVALHVLVAINKTIILILNWISDVKSTRIVDPVCSFIFGMIPCFMILQFILICGFVREECNILWSLLSSNLQTNRDVTLIKTKIVLVTDTFSKFHYVYEFIFS